MGDLTYTAAKSSKISKKPALGSPIKKLSKGLKRFTKPPTQFVRTQSLAGSDGKKTTTLTSPFQKKATSNNDPLVVQDYNVQLDYQLSRKDDILKGISTILDNQWSESSRLNKRYYTNDEKEGQSMETLVFGLKGLSMSVKADIMKYRTQQFPSSLITTAQLYSMYEQQGPTFVDKNVEIQIRRGILRKFVITNAAPVISSSPQQFQNGRVTYGFENVEVLAKAQSYYDVIKQKIHGIQDEIRSDNNISEQTKNKKLGQIESLEKFIKYVKNNPTALFVSTNDSELGTEEISTLVSYGLVTLTSNHLNEIESHQYSISYPACGTFLKLINFGRVWLVKLLSKNKYKESLEEQIMNKWEGTNMNGACKMNNFRAPFYGYDLTWILADALGVGLIEVFNTPVGRGWRLTGKV